MPFACPEAGKDAALHGRLANAQGASLAAVHLVFANTQVHRYVGVTGGAEVIFETPRFTKSSLGMSHRLFLSGANRLLAVP